MKFRTFLMYFFIAITFMSALGNLFAAPTRPGAPLATGFTASRASQALAASGRTPLITGNAFTATALLAQAPTPSRPSGSKVPTPPPASHPAHPAASAMSVTTAATPSNAPTASTAPLDLRLVVIGLYCLLQCDSSKELLTSLSDRLHLQQARAELSRFIPSFIINNPNRGMILSLLAGAAGTYFCTQIPYLSIGKSGNYDWINIILACIAGHCVYSCAKALFIHPEENGSLLHWIQSLARRNLDHRKSFGLLRR